MIPAPYPASVRLRATVAVEVRAVPRNAKPLLVVFVLLALVLVGCRNETQNQIRRSIQDFTNTRMYITVFAYGGDVVFEGIVDGKVTRASATLDGGDASSGSYIYWYDDRGRYHQTDLPYLVTTYDRATEEVAP